MSAVKAAEATAVPTDTPTHAMPTLHVPSRERERDERRRRQRHADERPRTAPPERAARAVGETTGERTGDDAGDAADGEDEP